MSDFYDRKGNPMSLEAWGIAFQDIEARRIAKTDLPGGGHVSTVWLGLDHGWGIGPPLIFETMVFGTDGKDLDQERYATEANALVGHDEMVKRWQGAP